MLRRSAESVTARMSMPSIFDRARLRVEGAVEQRERGRLAGAGRADEGDGLARERGEVRSATAGRLPS